MVFRPVSPAVQDAPPKPPRRRSSEEREGVDAKIERKLVGLRRRSPRPADGTDRVRCLPARPAAAGAIERSLIAHDVSPAIRAQGWHPGHRPCL